MADTPASEQHYIDPYRQLSPSRSFEDHVHHLYRVLREQYSGIDRFSLARYQADTGYLSSLTCAGDDTRLLDGYQMLLENVPSLQSLVASPGIRVVGDMRKFRVEELPAHSAALLGQGYRSSLTMPMMSDGRLLGMLFLNARTINYFTAPMASYCTLWGHWVEQLLAQESLVGN
ncbi:MULTISPECIES: GAF domain-containing protein [unclassified Oceanobacter]|jgi:GAF domain-containing protein|uniref:GAF domain-containing protein n=1 Tax=unclassified Oceanobacter TaxID=2620260 RepID=UPI0027336F2B|nr:MULTISPECIES: GAF domain-containing protein [unclassified Oceanobacter]MDP2609892.1 GAF domain-containing protein [Oceanobacter sp. 1_MG-2023]MDP2612230.1 GAF domain-containing protein [Oceanobacter sp. 2_MG-2023]